MNKKTKYTIIFVLVGVLIFVGVGFLFSLNNCLAPEVVAKLPFTQTLGTWKTIIESKDVSSEKQGVEILKANLKDYNIPIKAIVTDKNGSTIEYNLYKGKQEDIEKVSLILNIAGTEIRTTPDWKPRDINNFQLLFLE